MNKLGAEIYKTVMRSSREIVELVEALRTMLSNKELSLEERTDAAYALKICEEQLKAVKALVYNLKTDQDYAIWAKAMDLALKEGNPQGATIRTDYVTCTVRSDFTLPFPPRPKTEKDFQDPRRLGLAEYLNIPIESMGAIDGFSFNGFNELLTKRLGMGEPPPKGYSPQDLKALPKLSYRAKRPIAEAGGEQSNAIN